MANNISDDIKTGQRTATGFSDESEMQKALKKLFEAETRETYSTVYANFKKEIAAAKDALDKAQDALAKRVKYNAEASAKATEDIARLEEEKLRALEEDNSKRLNEIRTEIANIKKAQSSREITERTLRNTEIDRQSAYDNTISTFKSASEKMEIQYGVSLEAYAEIEALAEDHKEKIGKLREAGKVIRASISKKKADIFTLENELADLDMVGEDSAERSAEIKQRIGELRGEIAGLEEDRDKNEREISSRTIAMNKQGFTDEGEIADEESHMSITGAFAGARKGAQLGARFGPWGAAIGAVGGAFIGGSFGGDGSAAGEKSNGIAESVVEEIDPIHGKLDNIVSITKKSGGVLGTILQVASMIGSQVAEYISEAASEMKQYYGLIHANIEQSSYSYDKLSEKADNFLTSSRWIKQTDYLQKIAEVSNSGLIRDIETAAILEAIKNKTLTSFDSVDEGIQRLIRLNESDYIRQFGIETQLKKVLNSVFNDSGYLKSMFDSVTSAIMDAASSYQGDVTAFNSTVQTWMGYMYSSGLSSNVITKIAEGINSLGSGNLEALSGDEQTQRLFLLAMDRVGMDYADILQQGLSLTDTNTLLTSIVKYLDEIVGNTSQNNVLRSSYANLFNLSISDMRAIHQLSSQAASIGNYAVSSGGAYQQTVNALTNTLKESTSYSEEFDNLFANIKYTMGEFVAESPKLYSVYRISDTVRKMVQPYKDVKGGIGKKAKTIEKIAAIAEAGTGLFGFVNGISELATSMFNSTFDAGLTAFLTSSLSSSVNSAGNASLTSLIANANSTSTSNSAQLKTINRTTLKNGGYETLTNTYTQEELEAEEEDAGLSVLKEMAKTLMQTKEEGHYAFAVSLEGMNDNVLRSFASIFADEDAMMQTFTGDNKAIQDSLFNYLGDSTSNTSTTNTTDAAKKAAETGNVQGIINKNSTKK